MPVTPTGLAIWNYYPSHPSKSPPTTLPTGPLWNDTESHFAQSVVIKSHKVKERKGHLFDQKPPPENYDAANYDIFK
ncbi:hypothetical protein FRX31_033195, partial [Thalictrum thalictroides]